MEYNKEVLSRQLSVVSAFVQQLGYYRGLKAGLADIPEYRIFWSCTLNNHLKQATIDWCKVFGSSKEDIHWTKTPTGGTADEARQDFEYRVLLTTHLNPDEWEQYRKKLLAMRDKYVAHLDLKQPLEAPVPVFDIALQVADIYRAWVREVIMPGGLSRQPFSKDYEFWKDEAFTIASQYGHP